jgi:hypothetical protein
MSTVCLFNFNGKEKRKEKEEEGASALWRYIQGEPEIAGENCFPCKI